MIACAGQRGKCAAKFNDKPYNLRMYLRTDTTEQPGYECSFIYKLPTIPTILPSPFTRIPTHLINRKYPIQSI